MNQSIQFPGRIKKFCMVSHGIKTGMVIIILAVTQQVSAEVPPRFYWKTLSGMNVVPLISMSVEGNANPFDQSHTVVPGASFEADMFIAGYAKIIPVFDRTTMLALLVPMGKLSSTVSGGGGLSTTETARGYGDPLFEFDINLVGPPAIRNLPDLLRYEPKFSLDMVIDLAFPLGEYNEDQSLNIGQNRWYGRVGFPIIYQIGSWVPGKRTTFEAFPSVWWFGDNDSFGGQTLESDPSFELDLHLTRDLSSDLWGSLDAVVYEGGAPTVNGITGESVSALSVGFTLGYPINDSLQLTFGYKSTVDSESGSNSTELDGSSVVISLVSGWHPLLEGVKRLDGGE